MAIACATTVIMTGGVFSSAFGADGVARRIVQVLMGISIVGGLWYGWLAFRTTSAKKRAARVAADDEWANQFKALKLWLNRDRTGIVDRLLMSPIVILVPGVFLGVLFAATVGSFERYLSPAEFEAVQRRSGVLGT